MRALEAKGATGPITNSICAADPLATSGFAPLRSGTAREMRGDGERPIAKFTVFTDFSLLTKFGRPESGIIRKIRNICKIRNELPSLPTRPTESAEFAPAASGDDRDTYEVGRIRDGLPGRFSPFALPHQMRAVES